MISNFFFEKNKFFKKFDIDFISIIFLLIPFSLITGRALPDIFISIIGFYFLIKCFDKNFIIYNKNKLTLPIFFFSIYSIFCSLISDQVLLSLTEAGTIFYFRYYFFIMGACYIIFKNKKILNYFCIVFLVTNTFVMFDALVQFFYGFNLIGFEKNSYQGRLAGIFNDELILGIYLSSAIPISLGLLVGCYNLKLNNKYLIIYLATGLSLIVISGDRMALMHYLIFIFLIFLISKNISLKLFISLVSSSIITLLLFVSLNNDINSRFQETINDFEEVEFYLPLTKVHEGHIKSSAKMFIDKPLFGHGPKMFKFICDEEKFKGDYSCSTHPHNYYFQLLAETGIFGFLFLISVFLILLKRITINFFFKVGKNLNKIMNDHQIIYLISLFTMIWPLGPTLDFYNNWYNVLIYLNVALMLKSLNKT